MENYLLITGGSKGLGKAVAEYYQKKGYSVISLSRSLNSNLKDITQVECDLSNFNSATSIFTIELEKILIKNPKSITLINNAGTLGEINTLDKIDKDNIQKTVTVNYLSPLLLCSIFMDKTKSLSIEKKIRNISSGAAKGAYHGWSVYCSTKAAMDSFTKVIAIEQASENNSIHALSIYPGVIDTGMQSQIRESSEKEFSNVERFKLMKENGELSSPEEIAQSIYKLDQDSTIENGAIVDVRNF